MANAYSKNELTAYLKGDLTWVPSIPLCYSILKRDLLDCRHSSPKRYRCWRQKWIIAQ